MPPLEISGHNLIPFPGDSASDRNWDNLDSWAGLPSGRFWACGIRFELAAALDRATVAQPVKLPEPLRRADVAYLLYSAGEGRRRR